MLLLNSSVADIDWCKTPLELCLLVYGTGLLLLETILDLLSEFLAALVWHSLRRKTFVVVLGSELNISGCCIVCAGELQGWILPPRLIPVCCSPQKMPGKQNLLSCCRSRDSSLLVLSVAHSNNSYHNPVLEELIFPYFSVSLVWVEQGRSMQFSLGNTVITVNPGSFITLWLFSFCYFEFPQSSSSHFLLAR